MNSQPGPRSPKCRRVNIASKFKVDVSTLPHRCPRDWYFIAKQPAPVPHLAHPEGCAALRIWLVTVPRVSRSCEHFPDGFDLHLLLKVSKLTMAPRVQRLIFLTSVDGTRKRNVRQSEAPSTRNRTPDLPMLVILTPDDGAPCAASDLWGKADARNPTPQSQSLTPNLKRSV